MNPQRNPIGWFEIYVSDMARAVAFYETVLGVKTETMDAPMPDLEMRAFPGNPEIPGACGALVRMPGIPGGSGGTMVYFSCLDCAVEAGRVEAAGGILRQPKTSIGPYGFFALVVDPEGNMFGLHSMA